MARDYTTTAKRALTLSLTTSDHTFTRAAHNETMKAYAFLPLGLLSLLLTLIPDSAASYPSKRDYGIHDYFVLEHDPASGMPLLDILDLLGLELVEKAGELKDHWLIRSLKSNSDELESYEHLVRRRLLTEAGTFDPQARSLSRAIKHITPQTPRQRVKRGDFDLRAPQSTDWLNLSSSDVADREGITDPEFKDQWHLVNDEFHEHMVNVAPVWDMGIAGQGVISAMVDDGLDFESDDLAANFVSPLQLRLRDTISRT